MNSLNVTGRVVTEPERRMTQSGIVMATFRIAVKRPHVKDQTDFFSVTAWRFTAEYVLNYMHKGNVIAITGYISAIEFEKDGQKRTSFEIVADDVNILSTEPKKPAPQPQPQTPKSEVEAFLSHYRDDPVELNDPDLPF